MRWRWTLLAYTLSLAVVVLYDVTAGNATWFGTSGVVGLSAVVGWWAGELLDDTRPPLVIALGVVSMLVILGFAALSDWTIIASVVAGAGAGLLIERATHHRPSVEEDLSTSAESGFALLERAHSA